MKSVKTGGKVAVKTQWFLPFAVTGEETHDALCGMSVV